MSFITENKKIPCNFHLNDIVGFATPRPSIIKNNLRWNIRKYMARVITLTKTMTGTYQSIQLRPKERFALPLETPTNTPVIFKAYGPNGTSISINGQNTLTLTPRTRETVVPFTMNIPDRPGMFFNLNVL